MTQALYAHMNNKKKTLKKKKKYLCVNGGVASITAQTSAEKEQRKGKTNTLTAQRIFTTVWFFLCKSDTPHLHVV
jgi:hypothetical protein